LTDLYHRTVAATDVCESSAVPVLVEGWPIALCRYQGQLYAVLDRCPHAGGILSRGKIRRGAIMCPLHGAQFKLATGECVGGHYEGLKTFPVRMVEGCIEVAVPRRDDAFATRSESS
jgi:anthranilate 1,2-dioxygenase ferredoxin component